MKTIDILPINHSEIGVIRTNWTLSNGHHSTWTFIHGTSYGPENSCKQQLDKPTYTGFITVINYYKCYKFLGL